MKVYVVMSVGSGEIARICTNERNGVDTAKALQSGGIWKLQFEVVEMETDGPTKRRIVFSTLDEEK